MNVARSRLISTTSSELDGKGGDIGDVGPAPERACKRQTLSSRAQRVT